MSIMFLLACSTSITFFLSSVTNHMNEEKMIDRRGGEVYNTKVPGKISERPNFYSVQTAMVPVVVRVATENRSFTTDNRFGLSEGDCSIEYDYEEGKCSRNDSHFNQQTIKQE